MQYDSKIIIALDYTSAQEAFPLIDKLDPKHCALKVGKELFTAAGPQFVKDLVKKNFKVFLDLKFHDIPNTVARACKSAADLGVWMVNVHAVGGRTMMIQAREALEKISNRPKLIAVTVLTSMKNEDFSEMGYKHDIPSQVKQLAALTKDCGLDGVVCSALDARMLRDQSGQGFLLVTPGIRFADSKGDDQVRITTASDAVKFGADYLVVGRPITQAPDPMQALNKMISEINATGVSF
jgi:orotidine-5'-phosphate decarboxylase